MQYKSISLRMRIHFWSICSRYVLCRCNGGQCLAVGAENNKDFLQCEDSGQKKRMMRLYLLL